MGVASSLVLVLIIARVNVPHEEVAFVDGQNKTNTINGANNRHYVDTNTGNIEGMSERR